MKKSFCLLFLLGSFLHVAASEYFVYGTIKAKLDRYPFRKTESGIVDLRGKIFYVSQYAGTKDPDPNWTILFGKVFQIIKPGEVLLNSYKGSWGHASVSLSDDSTLIHLKNFPGEGSLVDGKFIIALAQPCGRYQYTTTSGSTATIPSMDFGAVPTDEEQTKYLEEFRGKIADAVETALKKRWTKEAEQRDAAREKIIAYHTKQAEAGVAFSQLELGKRYLAGDGVEKDPEQAAKWLKAAEANGRPEAAELLKTIATK